MKFASAPPAISVILATWRRPDSLALVLGDLARQTATPAEVVVIDQDSPPLPEATFAPIRASGLTLQVLRHAPGVVAARRAGVEASSGKILVFIDDDVRIPDPRFLTWHAENYGEPRIMGVCGQELSPPNYLPQSGRGGDFSDAFEEAAFFSRAATVRQEVFHLATCNCSLRRSAWNEVGGLDPVFCGNSYGDDYDLALRMRSARLPIVFDPRPSVQHTRAPMGGLRLDDPQNDFAEWEKYVSLWVFFLRHVPPKWRLWYLRDAILRKSFLLRKNALRPWCWPQIANGLVRAYLQATRLTRDKRHSAVC